MQTLAVTQSKTANSKALKIRISTSDYKLVTIPSAKGQPKIGTCYVRVTDLPPFLDDYMEINPRVPNRNKTGLLAGPVAKGIMDTLENRPEEFALVNQGIFIFVQEAQFHNDALMISLSDPGKHGIINGGHTYAAIREMVDSAEGAELESLKNAFVRLHIFQGVDDDYMADIAEGLNRSKQVDDPSLANLQGEFDVIRKALKGTVGESEIAYHQGDSGSVYVSELLVYLGLFNTDRFDERVHPNQLYNRQSLGLKYYMEEVSTNRAHIAALIHKLPDFLKLADMIKLSVPDAARKNNFRFGRAKISTTDRAGSVRNKDILLPFLGEKINYRVPNGWVYPMLAAFRANLRKAKNGTSLEWILPLEELIPEVIDDLVGVCIKEHRDNGMRPDQLGKRESAYAQCYAKVLLYLAKKRLL